jgi:hypothetical protein
MVGGGVSPDPCRSLEIRGGNQLWR